MYNCFSTRVYLPGYYYSLIGFLSESFGFFKIYKKRTKKYNFRFLKIERIARLFVSKRANEGFAKKNERFAHSLIYHKRPERIAHGCSFFMSDQSDLLTVTYLSWEIRANRSQSLIWSERWANKQIPNPGTFRVQKIYKT